MGYLPPRWVNFSFNYILNLKRNNNLCLLFTILTSTIFHVNKKMMYRLCGPSLSNGARLLNVL